MSNIGFRINTRFPRPPKELLDLFSGLAVANIADCMNRMACLDGGIRPLNKTPLIGTAFTVRVADGDNLMFHKALQIAKPGDVLMIAGNGVIDRAYCGELMMRHAQMVGLAGAVIDGAIRDIDWMTNASFPVFARGVQPNGPYKNGPGEIGFAVSIGGQVVNPGDIVVGDSDGIVIIPPESAKDIYCAVRQVMEKEQMSREQISCGKGLDFGWVDKLLSEKGCETIN